MSEIRFLTSTDEHLSDKNLGFRCDNYKFAILKKLEWQGQFAKKLNSIAVLRGGDLLHHKVASKTSMDLLGSAAKIHRKYHCETYAVSGNHDMSQNDPTTISGQPLGVLYSSDVFKRLDDVIFESGSLKTRVIGIDYTVDLDIHKLKDMVRKKDENYTVAVVHALAAMAPEEKIQSFFNEPIFDYRDLIFEGCPDVYVFGHYHKDQGIVDHLGVKFINLGSVSRGALTFENMERKPKISSIKIDSRGVHVEEHIVPHEDAAKVFDLNKKKQLDRERRNLDDFISMLKKNVAISNSSSVDFIRTELQQFPVDVRNLALQMIEAAEAGVLD